MRSVLIVPVLALAMVVGVSGAARAASEVACGRVQDLKPATATATGSFSLVAGQTNTVTIRAGETGIIAGYLCIDVDIVNGGWVFAGFIGPADPRFITQIPTVVCGTLAPNTQTIGPRSGPEFVELRNVQGGVGGIADTTGTARLAVPASARPAMGSYVCLRVGAAAVFIELVAPGADGYIAPKTGPKTLPSTSTVLVDSSAFSQ
jgi:hypothetical protein